MIVHVKDMEAAMPLILQEDKQIISIFQALGKHYWPGPITMVVKANLDVIPALITAQTGFVGIRVPNYEIAQ